jgi:hypothetical protein
MAISNNSLLYLNDEILNTSLNFCDRVHELSCEIQSSYRENFISNPIYRSVTKDQFISFFNILYSNAYDKNLKKDKSIVNERQMKKQISRECTKTIKLMRSCVIQAFLEAYYENTKYVEDESTTKANLIAIDEWSRSNFSDTNTFYLVTLNIYSGINNNNDIQ